MDFDLIVSWLCPFIIYVYMNQIIIENRTRRWEKVRKLRCNTRPYCKGQAGRTAMKFYRLCYYIIQLNIVWGWQMKREEVVHRAAAPLHHFIGSIHQSERTEKTSADKRITYIIQAGSLYVGLYSLQQGLLYLYALKNISNRLDTRSAAYSGQ